MNNYLSLIGNDIKKLWGGLELPQRFAIVVLVIITIAAMSYFIAKSTEPNWAVLYSDLQETDTMAVVENLKKNNYPYKISDDRKSVLVPVELKEELRIYVAENDIIHDSNPGFELLDKMQLGATEFQNKLTRQRIFQGELTRTIERIRGVRKVRVQIAEPERSVFSDKDESPSASVMLILEPGARLKAQQVKAIKNLVAYSIPRLQPDRVFLSDQEGNVLADDINKSSSDIASYKTEYENSTSKKVKKVLEKIVGYNNVTVEVSAQLNFDSAKSTIERYIPIEGMEEGVLASTQVESETYGKGKDSKEPVEGEEVDLSENVDKNVMNYKKEKKFNNYNVTKEIKQVVYAPGSVKRMTVAVAINKILTSAEKEEIRDLVISASGADVSRGDSVTVTSMQFAALSEDKEASQLLMSQIQKESQVEFWVTKIGALVVVVILGLAALYIINSIIKKPVEGEEVFEIENFASDEDEIDQLAQESQELLEAADIPIIEAKLDPELERMKTELNSMILSDPIESSQLLLSYIKD